jgi:hypothetical protein
MGTPITSNHHTHAMIKPSVTITKQSPPGAPLVLHVALAAFDISQAPELHAAQTALAAAVADIAPFIEGREAACARADELTARAERAARPDATVDEQIALAGIRAADALASQEARRCEGEIAAREPALSTALQNYGLLRAAIIHAPVREAVESAIAAELVPIFLERASLPSIMAQSPLISELRTALAPHIDYVVGWAAINDAARRLLAEAVEIKVGELSFTIHAAAAGEREAARIRDREIQATESYVRREQAREKAIEERDAKAIAEAGQRQRDEIEQRRYEVEQCRKQGRITDDYAAELLREIDAEAGEQPAAGQPEGGENAATAHTAAGNTAPETAAA